MFVYRITNTINNKIYIGKTIHRVNRRWNGHKSALQRKTHQNKHLQGAYELYGKEAFSFEILSTHESLDELNDAETVNIIRFKSVNPLFGYNKTFGGEGQIFGPETRRKISEGNKGKKQAEDAKRRIGLASKGNTYAKGTVCSEDRKERMRHTMSGAKSPTYGRKHTEEERIKMSKAQSGKILSQSHKESISKALIGRPGHSKGIPLKEETKRKISAANKGKIISNDARKKISTALLGKPKSEEAKANMRINSGSRGQTWTKGRPSPQKGIPLTASTKAKLSVAHKGKIISIEHREAISRKLTGKKLSPESIAKRTATRKANGVLGPNTGRIYSTDARAQMRAKQIATRAANKLKRELDAS